MKHHVSMAMIFFFFFFNTQSTFRSIYGLTCLKQKNRRVKVTKTRPKALPFCLAVGINDVMGKAGMSGGSISYVTSRPFSALHR